LLFGHKKTSQVELQVDLGDLENEKEHLTTFLQSTLKVSVALAQDKLALNPEKVTGQDLQRVVKVCLPPKPKQHALGLHRRNNRQN
jgi:hypothetical protein